MSEYDLHTTYPIPKYRLRWFHRLRKPCPECARLTSMRDNTYCSIAQSNFGHPNDILCVLCGKEYHWVWIGMGHFGGYWGWRTARNRYEIQT